MWDKLGLVLALAIIAYWKGGEPGDNAAGQSSPIEPPPGGGSAGVAVMPPLPAR
jgi:hypothetical protein